MKVLRFNQDATCCSVATSPNTLCIYNCDPFGKCFELESGSRNSSRDDLTIYQASSEENFIIEMLFSTSLIAVVDKNQGFQKSRKLKIVNTKRKSTICELTFPHEIIEVVMNRKRMCVLLSSDQIFIYDISCMKLLQTIDVLEGLPNQGHASKSQGSESGRSNVKISLSSSDDRSILCYTAVSRSTAEKHLVNNIVVFDALNVTPINYLNAVHKGNIKCLTVSHNGKLVATASEKGTIIRVLQTGVDSDFDANNPLLYEFRRGTRPSVIHEIKFNPQSTYIGCVGNTDTIHIFKLPQNKNIEEYGTDSGSSLIDSKFGRESSKQLATFISKRVISRIPSQNLARDYAHINVTENVRHSIGFPEEFPKQVYVAGDDGKLQIYELPTAPGECILVKNSKFLA